MNKDDSRADRIVKTIGGWLIIVIALLYLVARLTWLWKRTHRG